MQEQVGGWHSEQQITEHYREYIYLYTRPEDPLPRPDGFAGWRQHGRCTA